MNLKTAPLLLALLVLSLPLAGCGNKGPLVLAQDPPASDALMLPSMPPMDEAPAEGDVLPESGADGEPDPPTPPTPASGDGNG